MKRSQSHKKQDYKNKNIGTIVYEELNEDDSENLYYNNNNIISPINSYQKNFKNKMIYYENLSPEIRNLAINLLASNPINWNEIEPIDNFNLNDFEEDNLESFNLNNCNYENKVINDNTFFKGNKNKIIYKNYYCNLNNNCSNNKKEINNVPTILGRILKQEANKKNKV